MKVRIDATNFQSADDGNTTHYGGTVTVTYGQQTKTIQCHGTDREWHNCYDEIIRFPTRKHAHVIRGRAARRREYDEEDEEEEVLDED